MNRIHYFEFNGVQYPLCASLGATEEIFEKSESYTGLSENLSQLRSNLDTLAILMKYGTARVRQQGGEAPDPLTREELGELLFMENYPDVIKAVAETVRKANEHEIEGKSKSKKKATT